LIGSRGRRVYAVNRKTGEKLWDIRTRGGVEGAPVIAKSRAIFGSAGGRLSIIEMKDGSTVWENDLGGAMNVSPAVTDKLIVVGSEDGSIYAFKPSTKPKTD
ncbi:MAG: PQQ-binding-like beta-propeller repeat protein, partial [Phycisphaeraceae bacterium]